MEKKERTISLTSYLATLIIMALVIVAILIYKGNKDNSQKRSLNLVQSNIEQTEIEENNIVQDILDENSKSSTENQVKKSTEIENTPIENIAHIILKLEDVEAEKNSSNLEYKEKKITDKKKINEIMKIIDSAEIYTEKSFIPDFGDVPPCATIYFKDGKKYSVMAGDEIDDKGNMVNLMCKWYREDGNDKTLYKVNEKLGECLEKIFNEGNSEKEEKVSNEDTTYKEITKELDGIDVFFVTDVEKDNNKYTLKGVIYTKYTISNSEYENIIKNGNMKINDEIYNVKQSGYDKELYGLYTKQHNMEHYTIKKNIDNTYYLEANTEMSNVYKLTSDYRKITLDGKTKYVYDESGEESTVKTIFNNYKIKKAEDDTNPMPAYRFEFKNGKCVKILEIVTGH